ncbi:MAG: aspartate aminotransferase family protein [Deltaproteobacteria bacterium]|nr:aspartate aminotransferase family protein [Deltaproteobacteria bacterium]
MAAPRQPFRDREGTVEVFGRHVNPGKAKLYRDVEMDVVMGRRVGVRFYDAFEDHSWINCHCNGGVFNLGHRHPAVVGAVREALVRLDIGNHHLISGHRARLAERLVATTDGELTGVVFGVGGGEAIDLALKVCRWATGRTEIVSALGGYHGHTGLAMAAGDAQYRDPFGPQPPGFDQVPFDDLDALSGVIGDDTAAVILEPIPATLGMPIPSEGYLPGVEALCRERGAKLIMDEVQTGLGRTGKLWCYQHDDLRPDVVVTGKGLSGGVYPIAATLMTEELLALFEAEPFIHISTFGGAEPGCAAALTVLDLIETPGFLERVNEVSDRLATELSGLPFELRRKGLMMGLKLPVDGAAMALTQMLFLQGIYAVYANNDRSVLQLLPPLIISDEEVDEVIAILKRVFS